MTSSVAVVT